MRQFAIFAAVGALLLLPLAPTDLSSTDAPTPIAVAVDASSAMMARSLGNDTAKGADTVLEELMQWLEWLFRFFRWEDGGWNGY